MSLFFNFCSIVHTNTHTHKDTHRQPEAEAADARGCRGEQAQLHDAPHVDGELRLACACGGVYMGVRMGMSWGEGGPGRI